MENSAVDVVLEFVNRINRHDVSGLVALMTEDHTFVDGLGQAVHGRQRMEKGWLSYFGWFPDYLIKVDEILSQGNVVGLFGTAEGTFLVNGKLLEENHWKIPAAWKAVLRGERVSEWCVYADNEPVWKVMGVKRY
ncbi:MAG TPA: nuclear transport factor 2 family protein [Terriglobales bacterium]|nr:nuclear transport factor 2 family protein [Terriglobales bacterium]